MRYTEEERLTELVNSSRDTDIFQGALELYLRSNGLPITTSFLALSREGQSAVAHNAAVERDTN